MDSFTENLLSRARERQRLLDGYSEGTGDTPSNKKVTDNQLNLNSNLNSSSEDNALKVSRINSTTRVSSEITSSPKSHQMLNIQNDNFNMEIKVSSADNVRFEVQIEEELESGDVKHEGNLRKDAKNLLNRLGKLYAGGEDANISSPIHRTETTFCTEESPKPFIQETNNHSQSKKGLRKLADLAQSINQFEDDIPTFRNQEVDKIALVKKSWKPPAPHPPEWKKLSSFKPSTKLRAPSPPKKGSSVDISAKGGQNSTPTTTRVQWDQKESQGFTRTNSNSHLTYKYDDQKDKKRIEMLKNADKENATDEQCASGKFSPKVKSPTKQNIRSTSITNRAAVFESSPNRSQKDPALLSVSERKALFEKNKGTALLPKAPFAMATPLKSDPVKDKPVVNKQSSLQLPKKKEILVSPPRDCAAPKIVPPTSDSRNSGDKNKADSPKVAAVLRDVKRIKVGPQKSGRLYPSLTDIESMTETENENEVEEIWSPTANNNSFEGSIAESDDANTSFGRDILQSVCKNQVTQKRQILEEDSTASELSEILDDVSDYIDEALAYSAQNEGPTPPKHGRQSPLEQSHSFMYKNFQPDTNFDFKSPMKKPLTLPTTSENLPTHVVDGENVLPLTHTVSFYRKQQNLASNTPVKEISRQPLIEEMDVYNENQEEIKAKIFELKNEVIKQEKIIFQTSQALNLCNSTPEFMGSTEQVEAERVLLVATHRRLAVLNELQRLEVENTLRPHRQQSGQLPLEKGTLTISKVVLPLKQKYVTALAAAGGKGHHVVCLVKYAEQVIPTNLVSTVATNAKNPDFELNIPGVIKLTNVYSDFTVTFEVYCLQAQEEILPHEVKYHIKKPHLKLTPKKSKQDSRLARSTKESPAGPQAVRTSSFASMGYVVFSIQSINKKQWSLNNTPSMSPLEGTVEMYVTCELALSVEHRGFLTMFEDISGFGAWHRRWCLLKGHILSYWKYPDDERKTPPINSIDLKQTITRQTGPVSRDICARLHTFLLETQRPAQSQDKESLITVRKGDKTVIRHLLSADTKDERIEWCNKLNKTLAALDIWGRKQD